MKKKGKKEISFVQLEELEKYIREFLLFVPLPICTVNPVSIITDVNRAFCELTHYKETEIISQRVEVLFLGKKKWKDLEKTILNKELIKREEIFLKTKDKKKIPVSVSASFRENEQGNLTGYFLSLTDITEIKKLQEELEKKVKERTGDLQKKLEELEKTRKALMNILEDVDEEKKKAEEEKDKTLAVITNFVDGLFIFDNKNRLLLANPQAEKTFNFKSKEVINKSASDLADITNLKDLMSLIGSEIKEISKKELKIKENLILETSTIPITTEAKKIGTLVILHDITREKMIEKIKTEFVSLAAHQLRTPLSAIKWTLKMLLDGDLGPITKEQEEFIKKTYLSNERMVALINDLLNVTRIEEGRYIYKPTLSDFEKIVQFALNSFKEEFTRRKIRINFKKTKTKLPKVPLDTEKIKLVVNNFLDNAVKYTPAGGQVTISVKKNNEKEIEFSIKDTGVGIPEDQQERIFTKFFRAVNVIKRETEGSGLGLFISKNIIEAHGGKVWFKSKEGKGTTFYFTLPIKK